MMINLNEGTVIANSEPLKNAIKLSHQVAKFDGSTILILGESGTGKEMISQIIVNNSPRRDKPYLQVNCGAIPESLIEAEFFGYEKGAFTNADSRGHKGFFEMANGGTIFLDEIGEMPLCMQVKLHRAIQHKTVTRLGGTEPVKLNVRIIAATNKDLEQMVRNGLFREDLYYRLNVVSILIPPLRERRDDIKPMIEYFLLLINRKYDTKKTISPDVVEVLEEYYWPGNVRELENLVENLIITSPEDVIVQEDLPQKIRFPYVSADKNCIRPLKKTIEETEYAAIMYALQKCGSVRKAAAALEVNPSTITRKIQTYKKHLSKGVHMVSRS